MEVAEKSTFVKIDRNIRQWRWYQDANTMRVFFHLILAANIEDHDFQKITIHRGEVATSIPSLSAQLKISVRGIRTALEHLKATGEVTARKYPHFQVITILSYDRYQAKPTDKTADSRQASDSQTTGKRHQSKNTRTKEGKNEKNICVATHIPTNAEIEAFFLARGRSTADAAKFRLYNSSKGWKVGRTQIEDWQSFAEMWIAQDAETSASVSVDDRPDLDDFGRPIKPRYE